MTNTGGSEWKRAQTPIPVDAWYRVCSAELYMLVSLVVGDTWIFEAFTDTARQEKQIGFLRASEAMAAADKWYAEVYMGGQHGEFSDLHV